MGNTLSSLDDILKEAAKKTDMKIGTASEILEKTQAYSTGNIAIDSLTGVGGFPVGRSIELYGFQSSGKTSAALMAVVLLQQKILTGGNSDPKRGPLVSPDMVIPYLDYEYALDLDYCASLGIEVEHPSFRVIHPSCLEDGANLVKKIIETGKVPMFVWDSIAGASPQAKLDAEVEKSLPALAARQYAVFMSSIVEPLYRNRCTALLINHAMEAISMGGPAGYGPPQITTPGGRALKYYASMRLEFKVIGSQKSKYVDPITLETKDTIQAKNIRVRGIKNKVGSPDREVLVRVRYGRGFDNFWTALQILIAYGKIKKSGGYYYFHDVPDLVHPDMERAATGMKRPYIQSEQAALEFADERSDWRQKVIGVAEAVIKSNKEILDKIVPVTLEEESTTGPVEVDPRTGLVVSGSVARIEDEEEDLDSVPLADPNSDPASAAVLAELLADI